MKRLCSLALVPLLLSLAGPVWAATAFESLLEESGIDWKRPADFRDVPIQDNNQLPYEMAVRSTDDSMEIRYAIRPLTRVEIDYNDPHGSTPDPNHIFPMVFQALIGKLSKGGRNPSQEYKREDAEERFGADWAAMVVFDVEPEFAPEFNGGLMLAMHKNKRADAYVVYLFKDYESAKSRINAHLDTLRFRGAAEKAASQPEGPASANKPAEGAHSGH